MLLMSPFDFHEFLIPVWVACNIFQWKNKRYKILSFFLHVWIFQVLGILSPQKENCGGEKVYCEG